MSTLKEHKENKPRKSVSNKATKTKMDVKEISDILDLVEQHGLTEFELIRGNDKLRVSKDKPQQIYIPTQQTQISQPQVPLQNTEPLAPTANSDVINLTKSSENRSANNTEATSTKTIDINSPMVGTFYRKPAVDADHYVEIGDTVKKGDILCILEAMKLMNEIESTVNGRIVEILLEDGQMAEYGEALFRIEAA